MQSPEDTDDNDSSWLIDEQLEPDALQDASAVPWRILIVDDDADVHVVTRLALRDTRFMGRPLEFLSAYNAQQGSSIMRHEQNIALVLLDVVMETNDAGLRLARHIREDLKNHLVRVVLRTGQPGQAPERRVIIEYEINDYKSKSELTGTQLFTVVISALRAYDGLVHAGEDRDALSASLAKIRDLELALDQHALVSITDQHGKLVHVNEQFCATSGFPRAELLGRSHRVINSGFHPPEFFKDLWHTIGEGQVWKGEICNCAKDGRLYWEAVTIVPFHNAASKQYRYIAIGTDISASKLSEQALRATEERWKFALDGAGDGVWDVNFENGDVIFSSRWKQMNGYGEDELDVHRDGWKRLIHPDDLTRVEACMRAYFAGKTPGYVSEHRILCKDGSWKWVLDRGMVVTRNPGGKPLRMVGTHTDITERKLQQLRLQSDAQQLRQVLEHGPMALCIKRKADGRIVLSNALYGALFPLDALGHTERDPASTEDHAPDVDALAAQLAHGESITNRRLQLRTLDGSSRVVLASFYPMEYEGEACTIGWYCDITSAG